MSEFAGSMTVARASLAALRLQGLTLATLVQRGVLLPGEASKLVEDAAHYLSHKDNSPEIEQLYQESFQSIAADLATLRPGKPLPTPPARDRHLGTKL